MKKVLLYSATCAYFNIRYAYDTRIVRASNAYHTNMRIIGLGYSLHKDTRTSYKYGYDKDTRIRMTCELYEYAYQLRFKHKAAQNSILGIFVFISKPDSMGLIFRIKSTHNYALHFSIILFISLHVAFCVYIHNCSVISEHGEASTQ